MYNDNDVITLYVDDSQHETWHFAIIDIVLSVSSSHLCLQVREGFVKDGMASDDRIQDVLIDRHYFHDHTLIHFFDTYLRVYEVVNFYDLLIHEELLSLFMTEASAATYDSMISHYQELSEHVEDEQVRLRLQEQLLSLYLARIDDYARAAQTYFVSTLRQITAHKNEDLDEDLYRYMSYVARFLAADLPVSLSVMLMAITAVIPFLK